MPKESLLREIQTEIQTTFPHFTDVDWDPYNTPIKPHPPRLYFYTDQGRDRSLPRMFVSFYPKGFVFNYYNSPEPSAPYTFRNPNNSVYGPWVKEWQGDQIDLALEKTKIHMEGITLDDRFLKQPAGWSMDKQKLVTMEDRLVEAKQLPLKRKRQTVWDLPALEMTALATTRIALTDQYTPFNSDETILSWEMIKEIEQQTDRGRTAVLREINTIEAYEQLLWERRLL